MCYREGESDPLPAVFSARLAIKPEHLAAYLTAVGGGHPVHTSLDIARAAGFKGIPLPGVQLAGAALAACTRQLGACPVQLLQVESSFRRPVYVGDEIELRARVVTRRVNAEGTHVGVMYEGEGCLPGGKPAFSIRFHIRAPRGWAG